MTFPTRGPESAGEGDETPDIGQSPGVSLSKSAQAGHGASPKTSMASPPPFVAPTARPPQGSRRPFAGHAGWSGAGAAAAVIAAVVMGMLLTGGSDSPSENVAVGDSSSGAVIPSATSTTAAGGSVVPTSTTRVTETVVQTVTASPPGPGTHYQTYRDPFYGFTFRVPASFALDTTAAGSRDAKYRSPDGSVSMIISRRVRPIGLSSGHAEAAAIRRFERDGGRATYEFHDQRKYVVSGFTAQHHVYYEFRFLGRDGEGGFTFDYPASEKSRWDAAIERAYATFRPASL